MDIRTWIIVGLGAGVLASPVVGSAGGLVVDIVVGYQYVSSCQHCQVSRLQFTSATPRFMAPEIRNPSRATNAS